MLYSMEQPQGLLWGRGMQQEEGIRSLCFDLFCDSDENLLKRKTTCSCLENNWKVPGTQNKVHVFWYFVQGPSWLAPAYDSSCHFSACFLYPTQNFQFSEQSSIFTHPSLCMYCYLCLECFFFFFFSYLFAWPPTSFKNLSSSTPPWFFTPR